MMTSACIRWAVVSTISLVLNRVDAADWPQWRGPNRDGKSSEAGLLKSWPKDGPPLAWKGTGLGAGFASVSIAGGRIYSAGDNGGDSFVMAFNEQDGKSIWSKRLGRGGSLGWGDFKGVRATPTVDGDMLFAVSQHGEIAAYEAASGKEVWRKKFTSDFGGKVPEWGFSESPLVDGEQVLVTPGGAKGAIVALDRKTGAARWQAKGFTDEAQYSSMVPAKIAGVPQYVQLTGANVVGVGRDGAVLWKAKRKGDVAVIPTPVVADDQVYVASGYNVGCNLFQIALSGNNWSTREVYKNQVMINHHGGVILHDGHLYGHDDRRGWTCQDLKTGKAVWQNEDELDKGSCVFADGHLVVREEKKKGSHIGLIEASPAGYKEKGRFEQPDQSGVEAWSHPVIANGKLYIRDQDVLLCYNVRE